MSYGFGYLNDLADRVYGTSTAHGFWQDQDPKNITVTLAKLALITSEIGEAVEAARLRDWGNLEEELADIIIRVMDLAAAHRMNIEQAIINKNTKNEQRPFMHGKHA